MNRLKPWISRLNALTPRERLIILVLALSGIWALIDATLYSPLARARKEVEVQREQARTAIKESSLLLEQQAGRVDPDASARQRLELARQALQARLQDASRLQGRLVDPREMPRVLQGILGNQPGLRLVGLKTLPPRSMGLGENARQDEAALFRHGIEVTVAGDYAGLVRYMEGLEKLPLGFYWERAELDATAHPEVRLTLTLNTLALERTWLTF